LRKKRVRRKRLIFGSFSYLFFLPSYDLALPLIRRRKLEKLLRVMNLIFFMGRKRKKRRNKGVRPLGRRVVRLHKKRRRKMLLKYKMFIIIKNFSLKKK